MRTETNEVLTVFNYRSDRLEPQLRGVIGIVAVYAPNGGWSAVKGAQAANKTAIELIRQDEQLPELVVDIPALLSGEFIIDRIGHTSTWKAYRVRLIDASKPL